MKKDLPKSELPKTKHNFKNGVLEKLGGFGKSIFGKEAKPPKPDKKINM